MSLSTSLNHTLSVVHTVAKGLANPQSTVRVTQTSSLSDGTGNDQADLVVHDKPAISAGGTASYDLRGGLQDDFCNAINMVKLRSVYVRNTETDPNSLVTVKPGSTNGADIFNGGSVALGPGGLLFLWWPKENSPTLTDTADVIEISASTAASATVEVVFLGTSA